MEHVRINHLWFPQVRQWQMEKCPEAELQNWACCMWINPSPSLKSLDMKMYSQWADLIWEDECWLKTCSDVFRYISAAVRDACRLGMKASSLKSYQYSWSRVQLTFFGKIFANQLIDSVTFQVKMPNLPLFQLPSCQHLLLFFVWCCGFWTVGQKNIILN